MNPRIAALLDEVTRRACDELSGMFYKARVHDTFGDRLELLDPVEVGGHRYELRWFPALMKCAPFPDHSSLEFTVAVWSPTGELRDRRAVDPAAFVEMASELAPFSPEVVELNDSIVELLDEAWPGYTFAHMCTVTSGELDLVSVFVNVETLRRLALELGRARVAAT